MVCVHAWLLGSLVPFPWRGTAECALCSRVCASAAAEGADMGVSAVLPGASALVKLRQISFSLWRGTALWGQPGPSMSFWLIHCSIKGTQK